MSRDFLSLHRLQDILETLLGPAGCPWDREQTPRSLADYLVEEIHELVEAIRADNLEDIQEELGDVWFLLLFVGLLMERSGAFRLNDVLDLAAAKMVRRHPHVFANARFEDVEAIWTNWEREKKREKTGRGPFEGIPVSLPPLLKAYRIHSKAARMGFTWQDEQDVREQLDREWAEWQQAEAEGRRDSAFAEFGDYLFTLVEYGRRKGHKANEALDLANRKFLARFERLGALAGARGIELDSLDLEGWNALWDEVKRDKGPHQG